VLHHAWYLIRVRISPIDKLLQLFFRWNFKSLWPRSFRRRANRMIDVRRLNLFYPWMGGALQRPVAYRARITCFSGLRLVSRTPLRNSADDSPYRGSLCMGSSIVVTSRHRTLRVRGGKIGHSGAVRLVRLNRLFMILRACGYGHFSPCQNLISGTLIPSYEIKPCDGVIASLKPVLLSSARWALGGQSLFVR
jgi:hypothetical protein